jgi:segregation and condensation protein A
MRARRRASRYGLSVTFSVETPAYAGPFDVLARLVAEHKVDIYDVPLGEVVDAFVSHLAALPTDDVSEFLLVAAVLVELKSRKLLPGRGEVEDEEELVGLEERDKLLGRMLELHAYVAAAELIARMLDRAARSVPRTAGLDERFLLLAPDLLASISPDDLAAAYRRACAPRPEPVVGLDHVTVEAVTVSEAVAELEEGLPARGRATFRELTAHCRTRMEVIVRFLALLELCKRGRVDIEQALTFGDLHVRWLGGSPGEPEVIERSSSYGEPFVLSAPFPRSVPVEEYDG